MLDQQYYTSSPQRMDGQAGFGVTAQTPGLAADEAAAVAGYNAYRKPLSIADDDVANAPAAFSFYKLPSGRYAITNSVYVGKDYSGRWGNFFAHTIVGDAAEFSSVAYAPIILLSNSIWVKNEEEPGNVQVVPIAGLPAIGPVVPSAIKSFFAEPWRERVLAGMLQTVIDQAASGKRLVIVDEPAKVTQWLYAIAVTFPPQVRFALTFTTLSPDPARSSVDIIGVSPGETASLSGTARFQFEVFDMAANPGESPVQPGSSAIRLARTTAHCNDDAAMRFWTLTERLGAQTPSAVADAVWLDALSAGEGAGEAETGQAIALLGQADCRVCSDLALSMLPNLGQSIPASFAEPLLAAASEQSARAGRSADFGALASMAAAGSLEGDDGNSWLALIGNSPALAGVRAAIVEGLPSAVWQEALLRRVTQRTGAPALWWLLDTAFAATGSEVEEGFIPNLAKAVAVSRDEQLAGLLIATAQRLVQGDEMTGLNVLGFVTLELSQVWPEKVLQAALSAAATAFTRQSRFAEQFADLATQVLLETYDSVGQPMRLVVSASSQSIDLLIAVAVRVTRERPDTGPATAAALEQLQGSDAAQVRTVLLRTEGADEILKALADNDLNTRPPVDVIRFWIPPRTVSVTTQQAAIVEAVLDRLDDSRVDAGTVQSVMAELRTVSLPPQLHSRVVVRALSGGPIVPLTVDQMRDLQNMRLDGLVNDHMLPVRLWLKEKLAALEEQLQQGTIEPLILFACLNIESAAISAADYDAFLSQGFGMLERRRIRPIMSIATPSPLWHASYPDSFATALGRYIGGIQRHTDADKLFQQCYDYVIEFRHHRQEGAAQAFVAALPRSLRKDITEEFRSKDQDIGPRGGIGGLFRRKDQDSGRR